MISALINKLPQFVRIPSIVHLYLMFVYIIMNLRNYSHSDFISFSNELLSNVENNPFPKVSSGKFLTIRQNENIIKNMYDQNGLISLEEKLSNTSIIIPFYRKELEFDYAIRKNFEQYGLVKEVIIIFDEPDDLSKYNYLLNYNINFVFLMNKEKHPWRNPAVVINEGIKKASGEHCIVLSPETILIVDALKNLLKYTTDDTFCCGSVLFMTYDYYELKNYNLKTLFRMNNTQQQNKNCRGPFFYGSICCKKEKFMSVGGYDINYAKSGWGGEDNDIRNRLVKHGMIRLDVSNANVIHLDNIKRETIRNIPGVVDLYDNFEQVYLEKKDNSLQKKLLENMDVIEKFDLRDHINSSYKIILLTQAYNEKENVDEFMRSVEKFVDGIIVLDDGSNDNTWDLIDMNKYKKIILKISKKRTSFNDLENRNMLLDIFENILIKNNIDVKWFMWLDFDERLSANKQILDCLRRRLLSNEFNYDILNVPLLHMWDDKNYNIEYPFSCGGIQQRTRIIRHRIDKTPYLIQCNDKTLHFNLNPYESSIGIFPLQIKHLGKDNEAKRKYKYDNYTKIYDPLLLNQKSYSHFLIKNPKKKLYKDDIYFYNYYNILIR